MLVHSFSKYFLFLLLAFVLLPVPKGHGAEDQKRMLDSVEFEKIFRELVTHNSPWPQEDLVIAKFSSTPSSLSVPAGTIRYQVLNQTFPDRLGLKTLYISVLVNDHDFGRIRLRGELQLFGEIVCLTKQLGRHAVLTEEDIALVRRDISGLDPRMIISLKEAVGKQLKTSLRAGSVLYSHLLESPPLVKRGDLVTIMARSRSVRVTAPGEVRNAGAKGDLVRVKNLMSRREIYAKVLEDGLVETEL